MADAGRAHRALLCDSNVIVRLLTDDPPGQAASAADAFDAAAAGRVTIAVPDVVVAEVAYVMTSVYRASSTVAAGRIAALLNRPGVTLDDEGVTRDALALWRRHRMDPTDALLAATARATSGAGVLSFDRDFDRIEGVVRVDPAEFRVR